MSWLWYAGARWEDIVDVTAFLTDLRADFATFNRIYAEYFTTQRPTRTTVEVSRLPTPIAVELYNPGDPTYAVAVLEVAKGYAKEVPTPTVTTPPTTSPTSP